MCAPLSELLPEEPTYKESDTGPFVLGLCSREIQSTFSWYVGNGSHVYPWSPCVGCPGCPPVYPYILTDGAGRCSAFVCGRHQCHRVSVSCRLFLVVCFTGRKRRDLLLSSVLYLPIACQRQTTVLPTLAPGLLPSVRPCPPPCLRMVRAPRLTFFSPS